jgi:hypothetical protein
MGDSWKRCDDCLELIKKYGRENLKMCECCTHLYNDDNSCACKEQEE